MCTETTTTWFAIQIDRDFETYSYGEGPILYITTYKNDTIQSYKIFRNVKGHSFSYSESGTFVSVLNCDGTVIILDKEPDNKRFENTLYKQWMEWDTKTVHITAEDRSDYEPWAFNSLKSFAYELGLFNPEPKELVLYHNKPYTN